MKDRKEIERMKSEATSPKERLMDIANRLEECGAIREASSLMTIIGKLEAWQNK